MTSGELYGRIPLHYAALRNEAEMVASVLKSGENPNAQDANGYTPLHFAAEGTAPEALRLLLKAGADPSIRDKFGNTALGTATFRSRGNGELIELLRENGADPHSDNNAGRSPVMLARLIANYDVAQFFSDLP